MTSRVHIHPTADVSPEAEIGAGSQIWHHAQVREGARLGQNCIVGKGAYIDFGVQIGSHTKIQNGASIYHGATLEDGVFVGPQACLTNDKLPRAVNPDGSLKTAEDWAVGAIRVREGAAIGAHAVVLPGVTIGRWAMIGAGAVVTRDVPDFGLVRGNPARLHGYVCPCGHSLESRVRAEDAPPLLGTLSLEVPQTDFKSSQPLGELTDSAVGSGKDAQMPVVAQCANCGRQISIDPSEGRIIIRPYHKGE